MQVLLIQWVQEVAELVYVYGLEDEFSKVRTAAVSLCRFPRICQYFYWFFGQY